MRPRDRVALLLVALTLAFTVLALGGAPRWAACIGSLLAISSAVPYATSRRTSSHPPVLLFPLAVAAGLTALQLIPLPIFLAEILAPSKLQLVRDNATAWGDPSPTWIVVSFDPPATLVELASLIGYLALAYTCTRLASIRRARHWLAVVVAGVATLAALVTLVHHALGLRDLYGLYTPSFKPHILGPLLGVNHLASLLSLAVPVALALAVVSTGLSRLVWLTAAATLAATTLLTGSRGGAVGLLAGLIVTVVILLVQRRAGTADSNREVQLAVMIPAVVVGLCAMLLLGVLTASGVASDLSRTSFAELDDSQSKYQLWDRATNLLADNRWLGVGKGGFEAAFSPYADTGSLIYSHAENSYLQALLDWGLPGAALLSLAMVTAARAGARRWRYGPLEAGILGGLAVLMVHDIADFSLEIPAVAFTAVVAASILFPARLGTANEPSGERSKVAPQQVVAIRVALLAAATIVVGLALSPLGRDARTDAARIAETSEIDARRAGARAAQQRHPGDHVIAGRAAEALFASRDARGIPDPRALALIRRAIAMSPNQPGLHHLAARMLLSSSRPEQAAPEFAAAVRWSREAAPIVADVLATFPDPAAVARALPPEPRQVDRIFDLLVKHRDARFAYLRRVAEMHPREARVQALFALAAIEGGHPDLGVPAAQAAWDLQPVALHATVLGRALALAGDPRGAIAALTAGAETDHTSTVAERCTLLFTLAGLQADSGDVDAARLTLQRAAEVGASDRRILVAMHLQLAALEDRLGNRNQAEWLRSRARELELD